jgi:hypothetical protein
VYNFRTSVLFLTIASVAGSLMEGEVNWASNFAARSTPRPGDGGDGGRGGGGVVVVVVVG